MSNKKLQSFEEIFGMSNSEDIEKNNGITQLDIESLVPFSKHPFTLYEGERLDDMVNSIKEHGVIIPIIVRYLSDDKYEILSGHNRANAAKLVGLHSIPSVIREEINDDEAMLIVTETNLIQRSFTDMLYSERASVLAFYHKALKKQGRRTDLVNGIDERLDEANKLMNKLTYSQVGNKKKSLTIVGESFNLSKNSVARYIRLTKLNESLLKRVDNEEIAFIPAVAISYLKKDEQAIVENLIMKNNFKVDMKKAEVLKAYSKDEKLKSEKIYEILSGKVNKKKLSKSVTSIPFKLKNKIIIRFFESSKKQKEIEEVIEKALELYFDNIKNTENEI